MYGYQRSLKKGSCSKSPGDKGAYQGKSELEKVLVCSMKGAVDNIQLHEVAPPLILSCLDPERAVKIDITHSMEQYGICLCKMMYAWNGRLGLKPDGPVPEVRNRRISNEAR